MVAVNEVVGGVANPLRGGGGTPLLRMMRLQLINS
jgi:hypothetical protein